MQITMFIQTPAKLIHDQGCKQRTDHCELCLCRVLPLNVHSMAFVGARVILLYRCDEEVITKILDSTPEHHILLPAICHCNITHTDMKQSVTIYLYSMIGKKKTPKKRLERLNQPVLKPKRQEDCTVTHNEEITSYIIYSLALAMQFRCSHD